MGDLVEQLRAFDGRATTILTEIEAREAGRPGFVDGLIALVDADSESVSSGATWLIKAHLEKGRCLTSVQVSALTARVLGTTVWSAQLHVCQSVQWLDIEPEGEAAALAAWLTPLLDHKKPFLRAWSVDALVRLAGQHSMLAGQAEAAIKRARKDAAASVRARIRNLSLAER